MTIHKMKTLLLCYGYTSLFGNKQIFFVIVQTIHYLSPVSNCLFYAIVHCKTFQKHSFTLWCYEAVVKSGGCTFNFRCKYDIHAKNYSIVEKTTNINIEYISSSFFVFKNQFIFIHIFRKGEVFIATIRSMNLTTFYKITVHQRAYYSIYV